MYRLNNNTRRLFKRWKLLHVAKSRTGSDQVSGEAVRATKPGLCGVGHVQYTVLQSSANAPNVVAGLQWAAWRSNLSFHPPRHSPQTLGWLLDSLNAMLKCYLFRVFDCSFLGLPCLCGCSHHIYVATVITSCPHPRVTLYEDAALATPN